MHSASLRIRFVSVDDAAQPAVHVFHSLPLTMASYLGSPRFTCSSSSPQACSFTHCPHLTRLSRRVQHNQVSKPGTSFTFPLTMFHFLYQSLCCLFVSNYSAPGRCCSITSSRYDDDHQNSTNPRCSQSYTREFPTRAQN